MKSIEIVNISLAVVILFVMSTALFLSYLKSLRFQIKELWLEILNNLRKRADIIPLLVEIIRKNNPGMPVELINSLLETRTKSWNLKNCDGEKVSTELSFSNQIKELIELSDQNAEINKNYLYLTLKKDLQQNSLEIEKMEEKYNQKVRQYNVYLKFFIFIPVFKILKLAKFSIFEFEY